MGEYSRGRWNNMVVGGLLIREYEAKDHGFVYKLFSDALFENWGPAYRRVVSGSAGTASQTQAVVLDTALVIAPSFAAFFAIQLIVQLNLLIATYYIYWAYYREHMASDMRDEDLLFWTGQGESNAGFFVAEVDGSPVGTVAYLIKDDRSIEVCRLAVVAGMRQQGIGQLLVQKICQVGRQLGLEGQLWRQTLAPWAPSSSIPG